LLDSKICCSLAYNHKTFIMKSIFLLVTFLGIVNFNIFDSNHNSKNCEIKTRTVKTTGSTITVIKINKNKMSFVVTKNPSEYDFYINANFFADRPIGEVMIDNKIINKKKNNGAYFVSNKNGFDFTVNSRPNNINYSSQTHLVGIKNGKLNNTIMHQGWSKKQVYRILLGKDKDGNFLALHTNRLSYASIKDICEMGIKEGMIVGLIFDGGPSVNVNIKDGSYTHNFNAVPNVIRKIKWELNPPIYIAGNFKD